MKILPRICGNFPGKGWSLSRQNGAVAACPLVTDKNGLSNWLIGRAWMLKSGSHCGKQRMHGGAWRPQSAMNPTFIKQAFAALKTNEHVNDCLQRTIQHLEVNNVDFTKTPLALGPVLRIDSASETVVSNAEANRLLTRESRAPFVVPKQGDV